MGRISGLDTKQACRRGFSFLIVLTAGFIGLLPVNALPQERLPPEAYEWHIIKGIAAGQDNDWPLAEAQFREALAVFPADREATVGLGIALARQGKNEEALSVLEPAKQTWPDDSTLWEELAALYRLMGRTEEAAEAETHVRRHLAPIAMDEPKEAEIGLSQPALTKSWWGRALTTLEHDTNPFLVPDDPLPQPTVEKESNDTRFVAVVSGGWKARNTKEGGVNLGTLLYQSETQSSKLSAQGIEGSLTYRIRRGRRQFQIPLIYQYAAVDHARYQQSERVAPTLAITDSRSGITTLRYQFQFREFFASPRFPANPDRNGQAHEWVLTHRHPLQNGAITVRYQGKAVDAEGGINSGDWDGISHGAALVRDIPLTEKVFSQVSAGWDSFRYKNPNSQSPTGEPRSDDLYTASGSLSRWLGTSKRMRASLSTRYDRQRSNIVVYNYKRLVTALALEKEF